MTASVDDRHDDFHSSATPTALEKVGRNTRR